VTGQVQPGVASTASAHGRSAPVSQTDGSFAILGVPVSSGANALTTTVTDVSGNIATQTVSFSVLSPQSSVFSYDQNGNLAAVSNQSSAISYGYL
jgi:L-lactate permease